MAVGCRLTPALVGMKLNPLKVITVLLTIPMLAPFIWWHSGARAGSALEVCGILATLVGTLWLAAGVYIPASEVEALRNMKPKKVIGRLINGAESASHPLVITVIYLLVGAAALIAKVVWW
jgi:hypothetical protein